MSKQFWAVLVVLAAVFIGIIAFSGKDNNNGSGGSNGKPTNHVEGSTSTGVKLVEYGDYLCPVCGTYYQTLKDVAAKYNDKIQFQFRNLPLTSIHQNAFAGARAAEAAGLQGKYFEMHDLLYQNQSIWSSSSNPLGNFVTMAKSLKLNVDQFKKDYASSKVNDRINADIAAFEKTKKEEATPTFFLNGKYIPNTKLIDTTTNAPSIDAFSKVIDAAIAAKTKQ
jgi:protein-disulfide isomerase